MLTLSCHGDRLSIMDLLLKFLGSTIEGMFHSLKTGQDGKRRSGSREKKQMESVIVSSVIN